ncbi:MAG: radical SAM protein [Candidatus Omnitrophica bacterium]|nr:radical SAM protein [Candidatus Omnitrophota bacterium]
MLRKIELLKIALMHKGMAISDRARNLMRGNDDSPLTLSDYVSTSGISVDLGEDIWANVPIRDFNPNFVDESTPFELDYRDGHFFIVTGDSEFRVKPLPVPTYHDKKNERGVRYTYLLRPHTDRVSVSPIEGCANRCRFCDVPYKFKYKMNTPAELIDAITTDLHDPNSTTRHVIMCGGTPRPEDYAHVNMVYDELTSAFSEIPFDVMMVPMPGLLDVRRLKSIGINYLASNIEIYNERIAKELMPEKSRLTRKYYLDFLEDAVTIFGQGKVRSLLLVGLEPLEDTLRGVGALAERGCDPVLSPFRPDLSTPLGQENPPPIELLIEAYERARDIVDKYEGVKLGPRCIPCMHNSLAFPDGSNAYFYT